MPRLKEYETHRESIGLENLLEVNYDELIAAPLLTVKRIYDALNLSGFEENQLAFEKFIEEQKDYKPHQYSYSAV